MLLFCVFVQLLLIDSLVWVFRKCAVFCMCPCPASLYLKLIRFVLNIESLGLMHTLLSLGCICAVFCIFPILVDWFFNCSLTDLCSLLYLSYPCFIMHVSLVAWTLSPYHFIISLIIVSWMLDHLALSILLVLSVLGLFYTCSYLTQISCFVPCWVFYRLFNIDSLCLIFSCFLCFSSRSVHSHISVWLFIIAEFFTDCWLIVQHWLTTFYQ